MEFDFSNLIIFDAMNLYYLYILHCYLLNKIFILLVISPLNLLILGQNLYYFKFQTINSDLHLKDVDLIQESARYLF